MYNVNDLGKRIASYRKYMGITQEELADRLNITAQAVSKWENNLSYPDITILPSLTKALNTTIERLFGNEENHAGNNTQDTKEPKFPQFMNETLKLVHVFRNVACYSEKEVDVTNYDSVIFKDGSSANLHSLKIINKGAGEICFNFTEDIPEILDLNISEIDKSFDGITSLTLNVVNSDYEVLKSQDKKTHVHASGSSVFLSKLKIIKDGELLLIESENSNNNYGNSQRQNKVVIEFGSELGNNISAHINGSGKCEIIIPFKSGNISINGSGDVIFDHIFDLQCKINGSGDITCNKAGNPVIQINGSGDFKSNEIYGSFKSKINGSGDICPGSGQLDSFKTKI